MLDSIGWLYVGGVALSRDSSRIAVVDLVERARASDCMIVFDPNARPEQRSLEEFAVEVDAVLERADVVKATPSDLAAAGLRVDDPIQLARLVLDRGPHTVFETRGSDGAVAVSTDESGGSVTVEHDGFAVDAVATTGAGDAFVAGAISALAEEQSLDDALAFADAVAALPTTADGAMAALPDCEAVDGLLD